MYEIDSSLLEEKNHIAGCGVAEDSEGPTAEGQWRGRAKPVNTKHQTGQNTQDPTHEPLGNTDNNLPALSTSCILSTVLGT